MADRIQKYRKAWESDPLLKKWLKQTKDQAKAVCSYCNCELKAKYADLIRHTKTAKHQRTTKSITNSNCIQKEISFTPIATEKQASQAMLALYTAVHTSFCSVDHLGEICNNAFMDSKAANFSLHRTKCANIIRNLLAPHFIRKLLADLKDAKFSLILDEGTDISVEKLLGVVVRFYSIQKQEIVTMFLGLIDLNGGKAEELLDGLERLLKLFNLDIQNLLAIGTDNAASMTGINNGLFRKIKDKFNLKNLVLIRCVCHSLQLAVCAATENSLPTHLNFLVKESHNWFAFSSVRQKLYKKIYKLINTDEAVPTKIPMVAPTRWLSIEKAIKSILQMWLELQTHFNILNEKSFEATALKNMYNDPKNFVYLSYLASVLFEVQKVNLAFESQNADHTKLFTDLLRLLKSLTNSIILPDIEFDYIEGNIDLVLNEFCYLGYSFEKACNDNNISDIDKQVIKTDCIEFTKALIYEIRRRIPSNMKALEKISLFSVDNFLSVQEQHVINFVQDFITDKEELNEIETCIKNIKLCTWKNSSRTDLFWIEIHNFRNASNQFPFQKLSSFVINLLSYPYSNAEVERAFSIMNSFKSKVRNRMSLNTINSLIHIKYGLKYENVCCSTYKIPNEICSKINSNETYKKSEYYLSTVLFPEEDDNDTTLFEELF